LLELRVEGAGCCGVNVATLSVDALAVSWTAIGAFAFEGFIFEKIPLRTLPVVLDDDVSNAVDVETIEEESELSIGGVGVVEIARETGNIGCLEGCSSSDVPSTTLTSTNLYPHPILSNR